MISFTPGLREKPDHRILIETIIVMAATFILSFIVSSSLKGLVSLIPLLYFFIEKFVRKKSWKAAGFNRRQAGKDILDNWLRIAVVAVVIPIILTLITKISFPQLFEHIKGRLPFDLDKMDKTLIAILAATFGEEIIFRAFFQARINRFIRAPYAIVIASIVFGLFHYSSGSVATVSFDIITVAIDSLFYGAIFARTKNVYASWFAHCAADFIALFLIIL